MSFLKSTWFGAGLALAVAATASAQEAEVLPITLSSLEIQRFETLVEDGTDGGVACCAPLTLSMEGHSFVYVRAIYDVAWSDSYDRLSVSYSDIGLLMPGEEEPQRAVGRMTYLGEFVFNGTSLNARRPRDWPEETAQAYFDGVFIVPDAVTTATLTFADTTYAQALDLNVPVTEPVDPASLATISVLALDQVDEIVTVERSGRLQFNGLLAPSLGQLMQLDVAVQPEAYNALDGDTTYFFRAGDFTLVGPDNAPLRFAGVLANNRFEDDFSYTTDWDEGGSANARNLRLVFAGNAAPGVYKVFFHGAPVGDLLFE